MENKRPQAQAAELELFVFAGVEVDPVGSFNLCFERFPYLHAQTPGKFSKIFQFLRKISNVHWSISRKRASDVT